MADVWECAGEGTVFGAVDVCEWEFGVDVYAERLLPGVVGWAWFDAGGEEIMAGCRKREVIKAYG